MLTDQQESFMIEAIKVISEEARKSFAQGFELCRSIVFPPATAQQQPSRVEVMRPESDDDEVEPGWLSMKTIWELDPVQREAMLRAHGLQQYSPPVEVDPTHAVVENLTKGEAEDG